MTRKLLSIAALTSILTGCAANGPLPEPTTNGSVVDYANTLVSSTTAGTLDRLLDTVKDDQADGYRWLEGWWCPRHPEVGNASDVRRELAEICEEKGGTYEMRGFCRDSTDTDSILFLAQVSAPGKCSGGPTAALTIIEPTDGVDNGDYIARLKRSGFETASEREARMANLERRQQDAVQTAERERERAQLAKDLRKAKMQSLSIGTRICRHGVFRYTAVGGVIAGSVISAGRQTEGWLVGQLDGFSTDNEKIRFRVLGHNMPKRNAQATSPPMANDPVMGDFMATPGIVYWDDTGNWAPCE